MNKPQNLLFPKPMYRTNFQTKSYFVAFGFWSIDSKCFHIKWHSNLSITSSLLLVLFLSYRLLASYACTRTNVKCLNRNDCSFCGQQNDTLMHARHSSLTQQIWNNRLQKNHIGTWNAGTPASVLAKDQTMSSWKPYMNKNSNVQHRNMSIWSIIWKQFVETVEII